MTGKDILIRAALIGIGIPPYVIIFFEPALVRYGGSRIEDALWYFGSIILQIIVYKLYYKFLNHIING
mgnify:CR=1 FL=1